MREILFFAFGTFFGVGLSNIVYRWREYVLIRQRRAAFAKWLEEWQAEFNKGILSEEEAKRRLFDD